MRQISGLKWAKRLAERPKGIPVGRPRGAKRLGVKYEEAFAGAIPLAEHGVWFEFCDSNGPGYCQTDFLLRVGETIVILETKYTWTSLGHAQLNGLYIPVTQAAFGAKSVGIVVCKNLIPGAPKVSSDLLAAIRQAVAGGRPTVLQWLAGPVMPGPRHGTVAVAPNLSLV